MYSRPLIASRDDRKRSDCESEEEKLEPDEKTEIHPVRQEVGLTYTREKLVQRILGFGLYRACETKSEIFV